MQADKILTVMERETRALAETYRRRPDLFGDGSALKDQIEKLADWAERAKRDEGDSDFVEFTQFHLDKTRR